MSHSPSTPIGGRIPVFRGSPAAEGSTGSFSSPPPGTPMKGRRVIRLFVEGDDEPIGCVAVPYRDPTLDDVRHEMAGDDIPLPPDFTFLLAGAPCSRAQESKFSPVDGMAVIRPGGPGGGGRSLSPAHVRRTLAWGEGGGEEEGFGGKGFVGFGMVKRQLFDSPSPRNFSSSPERGMPSPAKMWPQYDGQLHEELAAVRQAEWVSPSLQRRAAAPSTPMASRILSVCGTTPNSGRRSLGGRSPAHGHGGDGWDGVYDAVAAGAAAAALGRSPHGGGGRRAGDWGDVVDAVNGGRVGSALGRGGDSGDESEDELIPPALRSSRRTPSRSRHGAGSAGDGWYDVVDAVVGGGGGGSLRKAPLPSRSPHRGGAGGGDWGDVVDAMNGGRITRALGGRASGDDSSEDDELIPPALRSSRRTPYGGGGGGGGSAYTPSRTPRAGGRGGGGYESDDSLTWPADRTPPRSAARAGAGGETPCPVCGTPVKTPVAAGGTGGWDGVYDAVAAGAAAAALGRSPHGGGRGAGDWGDVVDAVNGGRVGSALGRGGDSGDESEDELIPPALRSSRRTPSRSRHGAGRSPSRSPYGGGRGAGDWGDVVDAVNGGRVGSALGRGGDSGGRGSPSPSPAKVSRAAKHEAFAAILRAAPAGGEGGGAPRTPPLSGGSGGSFGLGFAGEAAWGAFPATPGGAAGGSGGGRSGTRGQNLLNTAHKLEGESKSHRERRHSSASSSSSSSGDELSFPFSSPPPTGERTVYGSYGVMGKFGQYMGAGGWQEAGSGDSDHSGSSSGDDVDVLRRAAAARFRSAVTTGRRARAASAHLDDAGRQAAMLKQYWRQARKEEGGRMDPARARGALTARIKEIALSTGKHPRG